VCGFGTLTIAYGLVYKPLTMHHFSLAAASPAKRTRAVGQEDGHELSLVSEKSSPGEA
jgi:hypothetical protein